MIFTYRINKISEILNLNDNFIEGQNHCNVNEPHIIRIVFCRVRKPIHQSTSIPKLIHQLLFSVTNTHLLSFIQFNEHLVIYIEKENISH